MAPARPAADAMTILVQPRSEGRPRVAEPVRAGVPLPRGWCRDVGGLALFDRNARHDLQARALDWWSDGSIRWVLLDFIADHDGTRQAREYRLEAGSRPRAAAHAIAAVASDGEVSIDTGAARFRIRAGAAFPFAAVEVDGEAAVDVHRTGVVIEDSQGAICDLVPARVTLEESGPLRAVVHVEGWARTPADPQLLRVEARLHFVVRSSIVRVVLTMANHRRADHPGGLWELGDAGSVTIRDASFVVTLPAAPHTAQLQASAESGAAHEAVAGPLEIYQASSGGETWDSRNHVNRTGEVPLPFRGYTLRASGVERSSLRAAPIVTLARGRRRVGVSLPLFWQNFPKAIESDGESSVTLRLFPRQHQDLHEIQGGEQKTHEFFAAFDRDGAAKHLDWTRDPLLARLEPEAYCASGAVAHLAPVGAGDGYEQLVRAALDGDDSFDRKRDATDEFGWRSFGDLYADHEAVFYTGPGPIVSHYNNQYDAVAGCAYQFMRSGDARWWRLCTHLATHVADVDIYHTDRDKPAYNQGLFWHTAHYVDAGRSTHRSYPRAPGVHGGGPSPEHNYSAGLLLHYFLTGDPISRAAVSGLAGWVVAMDDGARTPFRFLARGATGVASATASPSYHGPGRGAGNSINVLLDGFRVTGDTALLRKAESLIRRCIHPSDDIPSRDLLDAEHRWSYTVFLHALGKYLDDKAERGMLDGMYAYARASLLAYARWMSEYERPYLDHPERLQYPTETWVAQELWKSEVFLFAAKHADADERSRFLERADFFFSYAVRTLAGMPTRTLTRPLVLLLSHGFMQAYAARRPEAMNAPPPTVPAVDGRPGRFVPQKERARRRVIALVGVVLAALAAAAWRMSINGAS